MHDPLYVFENYERITLTSLQSKKKKTSAAAAASPAGPASNDAPVGATSHGLDSDSGEDADTQADADTDAATETKSVLQDRLDYAQAALICCTAWSTLEDLIGPHPEDLSEISDETWWLAFKPKL